MWGLIIACISGALMSIQGVFNTGVTKETGPWITNCFVQMSAFFVCIMIYFFTERDKFSVSDLFQINNKYMLLGGVIGVFITFTVIKSMSQLGPAKAVCAIVISQIIVGYFIEVLGLFGVEKTDFSWTKIIAMGIMFLGFIIFKC